MGGSEGYQVSSSGFSATSRLSSQAQCASISISHGRPPNIPFLLRGTAKGAFSSAPESAFTRLGTGWSPVARVGLISTLPLFTGPYLEKKARLCHLGSPENPGLKRTEPALCLKLVAVCTQSTKVISVISSALLTLELFLLIKTFLTSGLL